MSPLEEIALVTRNGLDRIVEVTLEGSVFLRTVDVSDLPSEEEDTVEEEGIPGEQEEVPEVEVPAEATTVPPGVEEKRNDIPVGQKQEILVRWEGEKLGYEENEQFASIDGIKGRIQGLVNTSGREVTVWAKVVLNHGPENVFDPIELPAFSFPV